MQKVMIASPCYSGKVDVPFAVALSETTNLLISHGISVHYNLTTSGSLLIAERNRILKAFMDSDCTHLLAVDSDLGWEPYQVVKMLLCQREFVAGVYPSRGEKSFTFRPYLNDNGSIMSEGHLLKMEYIPAGFMLIQKSAIQKMQDKFPELYFQPKNEQLKHADGFMLFGCEVWEGEFWGEDYTFCRKAREAGVDIWVDPTIVFNHAGTVGKLLDALHNKQDQPKVEEPKPELPAA